MPEIRRLIKDIENLKYDGSERIQAIKKFREIVPSGLAEAKWSVENWNTVKAFVLKNKRFPKFTGDYGCGTLTMV
jgi:ribosomal protein L7/L12